MSKKQGSKAGSGWKYSCNCGYSTLQIGSAVSHINSNKDHQLQRIEL
ncbi:MAG: hypothetical protein V3W09_00810 [Nitrososphaerales archaeon]